MTTKMLTTLLILIVALPAMAAAPYKSRTERPMSTVIDDATYINANNILMFVTNHGNFGRDLSNMFGYDAGTFYPYVDNASIIDGSLNNYCLYSSGLWVGGKVNGQTRVAIAEYSDEYVPGPMNQFVSVNGTDTSWTYDPDYATDPSYKVYKLYRDSMADNPNADWLNWPVEDGAPVDSNGNPELIGDQMLWAVYNDANPAQHAHDPGGTAPLGLEIRQTTFAFDDEDELGEVIFVRYQVFNRGGNTINDCHLSLWADPDLGDYTDDLVGCDTNLSVGFVYNSDNDDAGYYGATPPALGYDFFQGPLVPTGDDADSAKMWGHYYPGYENMGMTSFNKYINGTDPVDFDETYNYMQGLGPDGSDYENPDGVVTKFQAAGDPVNGSGDLDFDPADRRFMMSTGPITFAPGDSTEIVMGIVIGRSVDRLLSVSLMKYHDQYAQLAYDNNFGMEEPPGSLTITAPNGAESWTIGTTHSITWTENNVTDPVKLEYTIDNGSNWYNIVGAGAIAAGTNTFTWGLNPAVDTDLAASVTCRVRVTTISGIIVSDMSDAEFEIRSGDSPSITITAPNANTTKFEAPTFDIEWTTNDPYNEIDMVSLWISLDGGATWYDSIVGATVDDGIHTYAVADTIFSTTAMIGIQDTTGGGGQMWTSDIFSWNGIDVTGPDSTYLDTGLFYDVGGVDSTGVPLTWSFVVTDSVDIQYSVNGGTWRTNDSTVDPGGTGAYTFYPPNLGANYTCNVRVANFDGDSRPSDEIAWTFDVIHDYIIITSPVPGEMVPGGSIYEITWDTTGYAPYLRRNQVHLEYTPDRGSTWIAIVDTTDNDGVHRWWVPATTYANDSAQIRIRDKFRLNTLDSTGYFSISGIVIDAPIAGDEWLVGTAHNIEWNSIGNVGLVDIFWSRDGFIEDSIQVVNNHAGGSPLNWSVGSNWACSTVTFRIYGNTDAVYKTSDTMTFSGVVVTSPISGYLAQGDSTTITWETIGTLVGDFVDIEYRYVTSGPPPTNSAWQSLVSGASNDGSWTWDPIPAPPAEQAWVKINKAGAPTGSFQGGEFSISGLVLIAPNGGEVWSVGSANVIHWNEINSADVGDVTIALYKDPGAVFVQNLQTGVADTFWTWTIPAGFPASDEYFIRINSETPPTIFDVSGTFEVLPTVTIVSPNGGEIWTLGTPEDIIFTHTGLAVDVKLRYTLDGTTWYDIAGANPITPVPGVNTFAWALNPAVDSDLTASTACRVRAETVAGPLIFDHGDADFEIRSSNPASLTITAPNGGELWQMKAPEIITWSEVAITNNVKLEYTLNLTDWFPIPGAEGIAPGTFSFVWDLNPCLDANLHASTTCLIRVTEVSGANPASDASDTYFTIIGDTCTVLCGDVDGIHGAPDISDLVYLKDYMFHGGPDLPNPWTANLDGCLDQDIGDLTYLISNMFTGTPALMCNPLSECPLPIGGSISLDQVDGLIDSSHLQIGVPITFHLRISGDENNHDGIMNGFRIYSLNGADWDTTMADTTGTLGGNEFNGGLGITNLRSNGHGADTVGFGGAQIYDTGLPAGFDDVAYTITIGPFDSSQQGRTVCLDSAFYAPAGVWKWAGPNARPDWDGPHCYYIGDPVPATDLTIDGGGVTIFPAIPYENQETRISVVVRNSSFVTATNFDVEIASDPDCLSLLDISRTIPELTGGADATVEFIWLADPGVTTIYARVDGANTVLETNENNNVAARAIYVIPSLGLTATLSPMEISTEFGDTVLFQLSVYNRTTIGHLVEVDVNGLESFDWWLSEDTISMSAGEQDEVWLYVVIGSDCFGPIGIVNFDVIALSLSAPATLAIAPGSIDISQLSGFSNMLPEDGQSLATNSVSFMWESQTESTTKAYYKKTGDVGYTAVIGVPATSHVVEASGLDFDTTYMWYAESSTDCGVSYSDTMSFRTGHGVVFGERSYAYVIRRSYDQRATLEVENTDDVNAHEILIEVINPYDDLIVGFVGDGSVDQIVELGARETMIINLGMHAQDATQEDYNIAFRLTSTDSEGANLYDYASASIHVIWPDTSFELIDRGLNPYNLVRSMRLHNSGDSITDFRVEVENEVGISYIMTPQIPHAILGPNEHIDFELTPTFEDTISTFDRASCAATVIATGAGKTVRHDLSDCCDKDIFFVEKPNAMICAEHGIRGWYCRNHPVSVVNFRTPRIIAGTVTSATMSIEFLANYAVRPHTIKLYLNGHPVGELINTNPAGVQEFDINPSFLIYPTSGSACNVLRLEASGFNGGHYSVNSNMSLCLCVDNYAEYICANDEVEASDILQSRPYLFAGTPSLVAITEPADGDGLFRWNSSALVVDVQPPLGQFEVTAEVSYSGGATQTLALQYVEAGQVYSTMWMPEVCEPATITVSAFNCGEAVSSTPVSINVVDCEGELAQYDYIRNRLENLEIDLFPIGIPTGTYYLGAANSFVDASIRPGQATAEQTEAFHRLLFAMKLLNAGYRYVPEPGSPLLETETVRGAEEMWDLGVKNTISAIVSTVGMLRLLDELGTATLGEAMYSRLLTYVTGVLVDMVKEIKRFIPNAEVKNLIDLLVPSLKEVIKNQLREDPCLSCIVFSPVVRLIGDEIAITGYHVPKTMGVISDAGVWSSTLDYSGSSEAAEFLFASHWGFIRDATEQSAQIVADYEASSGAPDAMAKMQAFLDSPFHIDFLWKLVEIVGAVLNPSGVYYSIRAAGEGMSTATVVPNQIDLGIYSIYGHFKGNAQPLTDRYTSSSIALGSTGQPNLGPNCELGSYNASVTNLLSTIQGGDSTVIYGAAEELLVAISSVMDQLEMFSDRLTSKTDSGMILLPDFGNLLSLADTAIIRANMRLIQASIVASGVQLDPFNSEFNANTIAIFDSAATDLEWSCSVVDSVEQVLATVPASPTLVIIPEQDFFMVPRDSQFVVNFGITNIGDYVAVGAYTQAATADGVTIHSSDSISIPDVAPGAGCVNNNETDCASS